MKYNEQNIKKLLNQEDSIWHENDLDWFDKNLVKKLQNNQLPTDEKQKLINMMANDQMVMNRYLTLKQKTMNQKPSIWYLLKSKMVPLVAIGMALILTLTLVIIQKNNELGVEYDATRGINKASVHPLNDSLLSTAPEYFIINNKHLAELQINLFVNEKLIWSSGYQKSNKFYLPGNIHSHMTSGSYKWIINNKQNTINETYIFTIQD